MPAQSSQAVADRGLGDVKGVRSRGDAARLVQQHEDAGQVEIELLHIEEIYIAARKHLLVFMSRSP